MSLHSARIVCNLSEEKVTFHIFRYPHHLPICSCQLLRNQGRSLDRCALKYRVSMKSGNVGKLITIGYCVVPLPQKKNHCDVRS